MTKKKVVKKRNVAAKKFIVLYSDCGEYSQLEILSDGVGYDTVEAAKKYADKVVDDDDLRGAVIITEIVDVAKLGKLAWTGKKTL